MAADAPVETLNEIVRTGSSIGFTVAKLSGDFSGLKDPVRELRRTVPFTKLPSALFDGSLQWRVVNHGRWRRPEHITLSEARTVLKLVRILALTPEAHATKAASLQDNRPCAGAFAKGRSPAYQLNAICRQKTAACLAARVRLLVPWVESGRQPADWISRVRND